MNYKKLNGLKIVLDIDGTLFYHRVPNLGKTLPNIDVVRGWAEDGAIINISTMRSDSMLKEALNELDRLNIPYHSIYKDKGQEEWTNSPKCYGDVIVDDTCCGIPLGKDELGRDFVLLDKVDKLIRDKYENRD